VGGRAGPTVIDSRGFEAICYRSIVIVVIDGGVSSSGGRVITRTSGSGSAEKATPRMVAAGGPFWPQPVHTRARRRSAMGVAGGRGIDAHGTCAVRLQWVHSAMSEPYPALCACAIVGAGWSGPVALIRRCHAWTTAAASYASSTGGLSKVGLCGGMCLTFLSEARIGDGRSALHIVPPVDGTDLINFHAAGVVGSLLLKLLARSFY
jgi:hypothetical protein